MAKKIPQKRPKELPKSKGQTAVKIDEQVKLFKRQTEARYKLAKKAYDKQDDETKEVINSMIERLRVVGSGYIRIFPEGKMGTSVAIPIEPVYQDQNILFIATEILKDFALMGIRVANYKFPKAWCAECGEKLTK